MKTYTFFFLFLVLILSIQSESCKKDLKDNSISLIDIHDSTANNNSDSTLLNHDSTATNNTDSTVNHDSTTSNNTDSTFKDPRDGQIYSIKQIGSQVWMTQNLNYDTLNTSYYDFDAVNGATYGRLYDWYTALIIAPPGWHLPSEEEWTILINYLGGETLAGGAMKDTSGWLSPNIAATNSSGFSALPGGYESSRQIFSYIGLQGSWWTASEQDFAYAWHRSLVNENGTVYRDFYKKTDHISVRCLRN